MNDLTQHTFGQLYVLEKTNRNEDRYTVWKCQCSCGRIVYVNTRKLKRGTVTNCGCVPKMNARCGNKAEDLTNQRFGALTVIRRIDNQKGRTRWLCQCLCGQLKEVNAHELKSGKTKSCGCHYGQQRKRVSLDGQTKGRLTILYSTKQRDSKGSIYWHCRCSCGNEVDLTENDLVHGGYKSCGCLHEERQKKINETLHRVDHTCIEYLEKRVSRKDNTSGYRGVSCLPNGKYKVNIGFKGKRYYLGTYESYDDALRVRKEAELQIHQGFIKAYTYWKATKSDQPLIFDVIVTKGHIEIETNIDLIEE